MDRHGVRYYFEHRLLPKLFYEDKQKFVGLLLHDKDVLFRVINGLLEENNLENPYTENDFDIEASKVTDEVMMLKIVFPEPEEEPLCYSSYLFFDEEFDKISYFCIEKGNDHSENLPFVCGWTKEGSHMNYGNCLLEDYNDFIRCADIYMKNNCEMLSESKEADIEGITEEKHE